MYKRKLGGFEEKDWKCGGAGTEEVEDETEIGELDKVMSKLIENGVDNALLRSKLKSWRKILKE